MSVLLGTTVFIIMVGMLGKSVKAKRRAQGGGAGGPSPGARGGQSSSG